MSLLDQLRQAARDDGRPIAAIAAALDANEKTLFAFVAGKRGISAERADALAAILGYQITLSKALTKIRKSR